MARSKRTNFAKVKIWMPSMTSEVEGTIAGVALETFSAVDCEKTRAKVLQLMQDRHVRMCKPEEEPREEEVWSLDGSNGSWDYPSLAELIRDNYGRADDGTSFGPGLGNGLAVGDVVQRAIVCKSDPASFLQDSGEVQEWMAERACDSDAGEWADGYPEVGDEAKAALEQALEPLKAWARRYCQPKFFTVKDITQHVLTEEDVRAAK